MAVCRVRAVLVSYNTRALTLEALASPALQRLSGVLGIVAVGDASEDGFAEATGFAAAVNRAAEEGRAPRSG